MEMQKRHYVYLIIMFALFALIAMTRYMSLQQQKVLLLPHSPDLITALKTQSILTSTNKFSYIHQEEKKVKTVSNKEELNRLYQQVTLQIEDGLLSLDDNQTLAVYGLAQINLGLYQQAADNLLDGIYRGCGTCALYFSQLQSLMDDGNASVAGYNFNNTSQEILAHFQDENEISTTVNDIADKTKIAQEMQQQEKQQAYDKQVNQMKNASRTLSQYPFSHNPMLQQQARLLRNATSPGTAMGYKIIQQDRTDKNRREEIEQMRFFFWLNLALVLGDDAGYDFVNQRNIRDLGQKEALLYQDFPLTSKEAICSQAVRSFEEYDPSKDKIDINVLHQQLDAAIELNCAIALVLKGDLYVKDTNYELAKKYYEKALTLTDKESWIIYQPKFNTTFYYYDDYSGASRIKRNARNIFAKATPQITHFKLAQLYLETKQLDQAHEQFLIVVSEINDSNEDERFVYDSYISLGELSTKSPQQAVDWYVKANSTGQYTKNKPYFKIKLAKAYEANGDIANAANYYRKALAEVDDIYVAFFSLYSDEERNEFIDIANQAISFYLAHDNFSEFVHYLNYRDGYYLKIVKETTPSAEKIVEELVKKGDIESAFIYEFVGRHYKVQGMVALLKKYQVEVTKEQLKAIYAKANDVSIIEELTSRERRIIYLRYPINKILDELKK